MHFTRHHEDTVRSLLGRGKAVILLGARQVGKTTLVQRVLSTWDAPHLYVTGEDVGVQEYLGSCSLPKLRSFVGRHRLLVVDEAQYIPKVGLNLKMILDSMDGVELLVTGSSSLQLAHDTGAPLTGRQLTLRLYPLAQSEIGEVEPVHETQANLETRLLYGAYPEVVTTEDNALRARLLVELTRAYLFKDLLALESVRHPDKLQRLLLLLAHQVGHDVSVPELGRQLGMSKNTVERYLDLLQKTYVIFRIGGFSQNLRKEVSRSSRYYFVDLGIRNALLQNFSPLSLRSDVGMLWENYVMVERRKRLEHTGETANLYFWRTYDGQEIDLVEERAGALRGYEIKWSPRKGREPKAWRRAYPDAAFQIIHPENYLPFILPPGQQPSPGR